ncbi:MAG: hypothetical protein BMS9Abin39_0488 [Ignavibacteria bacterium]|nr:MAG: hypothetical protein BMS9Abin39_0488 [Ignavibacteria bacterium]
MKISFLSSNSISLIPSREIRVNIGYPKTTVQSGAFDKGISLSEKRQLKGMLKTFLGMVYFVTLLYFLFVLLS